MFLVKVSATNWYLICLTEGFYSFPSHALDELSTVDWVKFGKSGQIRFYSSVYSVFVLTRRMPLLFWCHAQKMTCTAHLKILLITKEVKKITTSDFAKIMFYTQENNAKMSARSIFNISHHWNGKMKFLWFLPHFSKYRQ